MRKAAAGTLKINLVMTKETLCYDHVSAQCDLAPRPLDVSAATTTTAETKGSSSSSSSSSSPSLPSVTVEDVTPWFIPLYVLVIVVLFFMLCIAVALYMSLFAAAFILIVIFIGVCHLIYLLHW